MVLAKALLSFPLVRNVRFLGILKNINMALNIRSVLISDEVDDQCVTVLKENGIDVVKNTKLTKEQLIEEIPVSR